MNELGVITKSTCIGLGNLKGVIDAILVRMKPGDCLFINKHTNEYEVKLIGET